MSCRRCFALAAGLSLVACEEQTQEVVWEGEWIDYALDPQDAGRLCAGTPRHLDESAGAIADRLNVERHGTVTYNFTPRGLPRDCPEFVGGCADSHEVFSKRVTSVHELVHAYAYDYGRAHPFFEEGLAEYLGGASSVPAIGDPQLELHEGYYFDPLFYPLAGRTIAAAVERASLHDVLAAYLRSDYDDEPARVDALFESSVGADVAILRDEIFADTGCSSRAYREDPVVCSGEPLAPYAANRYRIERNVRCSDAGVVGTKSIMFVSETIEIHGVEPVSVYAQLLHGHSVIITPCDPGCAHGDAIRVNEGINWWPIELRPGRYALRLRVEKDGPVEFLFEY